MLEFSFCIIAHLRHVMERLRVLGSYMLRSTLGFAMGDLGIILLLRWIMARSRRFLFVAWACTVWFFVIDLPLSVSAAPHRSQRTLGGRGTAPSGALVTLVTVWLVTSVHGDRWMFTLRFAGVVDFANHFLCPTGARLSALLAQLDNIVFLIRVMRVTAEEFSSQNAATNFTFPSSVYTVGVLAFRLETHEDFPRVPHHFMSTGAREIARVMSLPCR